MVCGEDAGLTGNDIVIKPVINLQIDDFSDCILRQSQFVFRDSRNQGKPLFVVRMAENRIGWKPFPEILRDGFIVLFDIRKELFLFHLNP